MIISQQGINLWQRDKIALMEEETFMIIMVL
jgi:hypothetical protein